MWAGYAGLKQTPEVDLESALAKIETTASGMESFGPQMRNACIWHAMNFVTENWAKLEAKYGTGGLTKRHAAFINLWTQTSPLYSRIGQLCREDEAVLRSGGRDSLVPFFPFLKGFYGGLYSLPLCPGSVLRGVKANLRSHYAVGTEKIFYGPTSVCNNAGFLESGEILGQSGARTVFQIQARSLVNISDFSNFSEEEEFILLPGTRLKVIGVMDAGNGLVIIQMKEIEPFVATFDFVHPALKVS